jgi:ethanolaminephosphotransferase
VSYARFCTLVISDITSFLGIACFTVRKKDLSGQWRRAASVDKIMVGKKQ